MFDVLVYLVRHRARLVTKNELLDAVWGDRFVSESALTSRLKAARRAVGDTGAEQRLIRTVFGRGYQFVGTVAERDSSPVEITEHAAIEPHRAGGIGWALADPQRDPVLHRAGRHAHRLRHLW